MSKRVALLTQAARELNEEAFVRGAVPLGKAWNRLCASAAGQAASDAEMLDAAKWLIAKHAEEAVRV